MANKNVQLKGMNGDLLFPKTKASVVTNADGLTLEGVEAGAQVNKIEKIQLNGVDLAINNKVVNVTTDTDTYTITKAATPDAGMSATYQLYKGATAVGAKINIPSDMVVSSGELKTCTTADDPVEGLVPGDKYIDLVLANADNSHVYIPVTDLVDIYTAGNGININSNAISIDTEVVATKSDIATINTALSNKADKATTLAGYGIANAYTKDEADGKFLTEHQDISGKLDVSKVKNTVSATAGDVYDAPYINSKLAEKQNVIDADHKLAASLVSGLANVATSGSYADLSNTPSNVSAFTNDAGYLVASDIANKADKATTLAGYGITDSIIYEELA